MSFLRRDLLPLVKQMYANKMVEADLRKRGLDVFVSPRYRVVDCEFEGFNKLFGSGKLAHCKVGAYTYFQDGTNIAYANIGRYCSFGPGSIVAHGEHPLHFVSTSPLFYNPYLPWRSQKFTDKVLHNEHKTVEIGSDVWVGFNCYIKDGVRIGTGSVIASGSVVVNDVEPYSIVGGLPAREIRKRFPEPVIARLLESRWWEMEPERLPEIKALFQTPVDDALMDALTEALDKIAAHSHQ
ncbi:MAG: CatB-related O-acetyltransferase [Flavobacteriales bacterium]|nr:CatB-related O-acetyltransferase [Flavobacteriales bacterium]